MTSISSTTLPTTFDEALSVLAPYGYTEDENGTLRYLSGFLGEDSPMLVTEHQLRADKETYEGFLRRETQRMTEAEKEKFTLACAAIGILIEHIMSLPGHVPYNPETDPAKDALRRICINTVPRAIAELELDRDENGNLVCLEYDEETDDCKSSPFTREHCAQELERLKSEALKEEGVSMEYFYAFHGYRLRIEAYTIMLNHLDKNNKDGEN